MKISFRGSGSSLSSQESRLDSRQEAPPYRPAAVKPWGLGGAFPGQDFLYQVFSNRGPDYARLLVTWGWISVQLYRNAVWPARLSAFRALVQAVLRKGSETCFFHLLICAFYINTHTHTPMPTYALSVKIRGITAAGDRVKLRDQCRVFRWPLSPWWMRGAPDRHGITLMWAWEFPAWPSANSAPGIRWPGRWTSVLWCPSHTASRQKQNVWA